MPRKTIAATAAFATAAATLLAAPAAEAAGRGVTHVKVTKKHTVSAPATLRPGVAHLRNDGKNVVLIVRKKKESAESLVKYIRSGKLSQIKRVYTRFVPVDLLRPRANDYVRLTRGTYYLVPGVSKPTVAQVRTVVVRGKTSNAKRPAARNLTVTRAGALSGANTGPARLSLRVRNHGSAVRELVVLRMSTKVTDAQLNDLIARPSEEKLFELMGDGLNINEVLLAGPGQDVTTSTTLRAGRYVLWSVKAFSTSGKIRAGELARLTLS